MSVNAREHVLPSANRYPLEEMWNLWQRTGKTKSEKALGKQIRLPPIPHAHTYTPRNIHRHTISASSFKSFKAFQGNPGRQQWQNTTPEISCQQLHNCINMQIPKRKHADSLMKSSAVITPNVSKTIWEHITAHSLGFFKLQMYHRSLSWANFLEQNANLLKDISSGPKCRLMFQNQHHYK